MNVQPAAQRLAWLLALAGPVLAAAPQDPGPPPAAQDPDEVGRNLEELRRLNAEMLQASREAGWRAEVDLILLGRVGTWPSADPEASPAEGWRDAVLAAPALSASEVLGTVEKLAVQVARTPAITARIPDRELLFEAVRSVHAADGQTHPNAPVVLALGLELAQTEWPFDGGSETVRLLRVESTFVVPARVLRGEDIHHARLELATFDHVVAGFGPVGREEIAAGVEASIAGLFARAAQSTTALAGSGPWAAWLADPTAAETRLAEFRESYATDDALNAGIAGLPAVGVVEARYTGHEQNAEAAQLSAHSLRQSWIDALRELGTTVGAPGAPGIALEVTFDASAGSAHMEFFGGCASRAALRDAGCLAVLDGRFVRAAATRTP